MKKIYLLILLSCFDLVVKGQPCTISILPTSSTVCLGSSATFAASGTAPALTLLNQNFNTGMTGSVGGTWTIINSGAYSGSAYNWSILASNPWSDVTVTGDGTSFIGANADLAGSAVTLNSQLISPTISTVGFSSATLTFNHLCNATWSTDFNQEVDYSTNGGATWTSMASYTGTSVGSATWSAGTPQVTINLPAAALNQATLSLRFYYNSNWGFWWAVDNIVLTGVPPPTFTWTGLSGASGLGCTACATNTITPTASGANVYTVVASATGCTSAGTTVTVNVNPAPAAIGGAAALCQGLTTTLTDATSGGTWSSGTPANATIGSSTGVVTGVAAGTSTITYTLTATGCKSTRTITINPTPGAITGTPSACVGATANLSDASPSGTWSSGTTVTATIGSSSGVLTGVSAGFAIITYTLPTGCIATVQASVNPLPVTTITPSTSTVCLGQGATFTATSPLPAFTILNQDFNSGLGTWVIAATSGVPASNWRITTTPSSGVSGDGTPMLESDAEYVTPTTTTITSPSFSTVGYGTALLTFNEYLISLSSSDANVDVQYSINGGTTWNLVNSQVNVITGGFTWSAASPEVSVSLPAGALGQPNVKLRWLYNSNFGLYWDIDNIKVTAYQPAVTYNWTGLSGATGLSCAACASPTITPGATGANAYSVTSTTSSGCISNNGVTVNVNPLPVAIGGTMVVCVNATTSLTDANPGGTWSTGSATLNVGLSTGVVTGVSAGTGLVTYTLPTGCAITAQLTINALPSAITGTAQVCIGSTTTLSDPSPGGTWSSTAPATASVDVAGVVTGNLAGNATIKYTLTSTGCAYPLTVTVNALPLPIGGTLQVCEGLTTSLTDANAGGTWTSGTPAVATIGAASGVASGIVSGVSVITYQLPTGCIRTGNLVVNPLPAAISGTLQVCPGRTTTLSDASTGGTWASSSVANATISASGVVTGVAAGGAVITYTLPTGCMKTANSTVNPLPAPIGGTLQVCENLTTALSDATAGGTWTSGATGIATIDASGIATGIIHGTSAITYTLPTGCAATANLIVNPTPAPLAGSMQVCQGLNTMLTDASTGGTWGSGTPTVAAIDATGLVTAIVAGTSTITYTLPTGCINTADVSVNPLPAAIAGSGQVCEGLNTILTDASAGGVWSSGTPTVATIDATGMVTAIVAGNTTITYTLPTSCLITSNIQVNPTPAPITGGTQVCAGLNTTLSSASAGGTWSSSTTAVATIGAATGVATGVLFGNTTITYTLPTTCLITQGLTVNALPAPITGALQVCAGSNTVLSSATSGGVWTSGAAGIATIGAGSGVASGIGAGNATVTYTVSTGCVTSTTLTVNPLPAAITGTAQVCAGLTTSLSNASAGGTWISSVPGIASIVSGSGLVTGISMGNSLITYVLPTSCQTTATLTVNPLPAPITGASQACENTTAALGDGSAGGTWSSSTPIVATISGTGIVSAIGAGTTLVTYTLPTGCLRTKAFVVNPLPANISGTMQVCETNTTTLANTIAGGFWSSSVLSVAAINSAGVVNALSAGTTSITYTLPTGCLKAADVTVNALPAPIAGSLNACQAHTVTLSDATTGGSWTSSTTSVATIDGGGVLTGVTAGTTNITYTLPTGCSASRSMLINPLPAPISGTTQVCYGSMTALSDVSTGGIWSTSSSAIANVDLLSGVVTGLTAGSANITYTLLTGCAVSTGVVVNPLPGVITGSLNVCFGQATTLATTSTGGIWSSSNAAVAPITTTGVVSGLLPGNSIITYTLPTGCVRAGTVSVNSLPAVYHVTGGGHYCAGGTGVHIGVDTSVSGVNYQLYLGATAVGLPATGLSGLPADMGSITPAGTYSIVARNAATGCASNMTGTATVTIDAIVVPAVSLSTGVGETVCASTLTTFTGSFMNAGTTPSYQWKVNGVVIPAATDGTYNYIPSNGDVVTLTMTSSAACATPATAADTKTMTVNPNMLPTVLATAVPGNVICQGTTVTFNVSSAYGGTAPVYTWMKNGGVAGSGTSFAYAPANGDVVYAKMASNYTCRLADSVSSTPISITSSPIFVPVIDITANPGTTVQPGTSVTLTANVAAGGPAPMYQWYINTMPISGATNATFTNNAFANGDSVSCDVTGSGLCGLTAFNSVIMHVVGSNGISNVSGTGSIILVPNPNKGNFTVKGTLTVKVDQEVTIEVTNMLGQTVYHSKVMTHNGNISEQIKLDNTVANGMYMLNMISENEKNVFHFVLEQ